MSSGWRMTPLVQAISLAVMFAVTGCHSTSPSRPDVDSLAFIEVRGHRTLEVARVVSEVFREAGYTAVPLGPNKAMNLTFEKAGSTTDSVMYGDWSGGVWMRVKIHIENPDPDVQLVKCDAYRVVGHGDVRFEEEKKITFRKAPYQELLDRAKARLSNESGNQ